MGEDIKHLAESFVIELIENRDQFENVEQWQAFVQEFASRADDALMLDCIEKGHDAPDDGFFKVTAMFSKVIAIYSWNEVVVKGRT